jgi:hypothetical protein
MFYEILVIAGLKDGHEDATPVSIPKREYSVNAIIFCLVNNSIMPCDPFREKVWSI